MDRIFFLDVLDSEVVHAEAERDCVVFVSEESWGDSGWFVSGCFKAWEQSVISHSSGLWESVHAFGDFDIDVSVVDEWGEVVQVDDFLWDGFDGNA